MGVEVSVLNVPESPGANAGERPRARSVSKSGSGEDSIQRSVQRKEPLPLPSSTDFSLDQQHANCVASLATQMVITTAMKEKTSSTSGGCVGDVITEYTLRSARKPLSKPEQQQRGKRWHSIKNRTVSNIERLKGICMISLLITSGCVMYLRLSISSKGRRGR